MHWRIDQRTLPLFFSETDWALTSSKGSVGSMQWMSAGLREENRHWGLPQKLAGRENFAF